MGDFGRGEVEKKIPSSWEIFKELEKQKKEDSSLPVNSCFHEPS